MSADISTKELEFLDEIDANFPYNDETRAHELIAKAAAFSNNSVFAIMYELCYLPTNVQKQVSESARIELLTVCLDKLNHPTKQLASEVSTRLIKGEDLSVSEAISAMRRVAKYPDAYGLLSILYMSSDDKDGEAERIYDQITSRWDSAAS